MNDTNTTVCPPCGFVFNPAVTQHQHILVPGTGTWRPVEMKKKPEAKQEKSPGTHLGHLDAEARARRAIKNARNRKNREARA